MANVLDLRRRIRSVKNTRQITKAMKMVSAAKLRRAQERALAARPYARMLTNVLESLVKRTDIFNAETGDILHPLLIEREEKNVLLVVVGGDKGFAGAFNGNILKAAQKFADERVKAGQTVDVEAVGRKARDYFRRRYPEAKLPHADHAAGLDDHAPQQATERHRASAIEVTGDHAGLLGALTFDEVGKLAHQVVLRYERTEIDAVYVVYNEFKSVISQRVVVEKMLPVKKLGESEITAAEEMSLEQKEEAAQAALHAGVSLKAPSEDPMEAEAKKFGTAEVEYIFDDSAEALFSRLMPRYVATQLFHAMLESVAAEHAARMTAMDSATNNASDMIDSLTLTMNRVRQAAITKEIIEIVSGAAAL